MIQIEGRRIAIVGGGGFIGHNLAISLAKQGAKVDIIDSLQVNNLLSFASARDEQPHRELYIKMLNQRLDLVRDAGISLHPVDARDYHVLCRVLADLKPQVVIHLAAVAHAGASNKDPFSTFDHSLRTLENSLDYSRDNVEHFIYLSSSMVYGNFMTETVDEEHPLNPIGIYGALKLGGEKMVIAYQQVFGLSYTIIRPSALYGPRCVSRRVSQVFIESALKGQPLKIEGDGSDKLDFTNIVDLVQGVTLAIQDEKARNQVFNITYGKSRSMRDLVQILQKHFPDVKLEYLERNKLMPVRGTLSVERARRLIGYEPREPLESGIARYIDWYRSLQ